MRCMTCGAESNPTDRFCGTCGAPLQQAGQPTTQSPGQVAAQPAVTTQQPQQQQSAGDTQTDAAPYQVAPHQEATYQTASRPPAQAPQAPQGKQASGAPFVLAIIALVTALIGLFPVSLVLAIIALAMNSGQKKRGEQSTKQTPTFVMGLISLILSILVALITLLLGGVVWFALIDDDGDVADSDSTSVASSQPATEGSPVGLWAVVSLTDGEDSYDEDYLKLMESMGVTVELVIAEDGTASLELFDETEVGTWEGRSAGKIALTFDGDTLEGTVSGDEMSFSYDDGDGMTLRRTSESAPATAGARSNGTGSSSSSAAASSKSSASSSASSKSSAQTAVRDADGDPTLDDFAWYAGAGGIPEGADILTSVYDIGGTWKAYVFGEDMERLCTMRIEAGQGSATATIDWLYVHDSSTDTGHADDTPDSTFEGDWDGALGLEAVGAGRLALTDFWQKGDRQYGMGSFMWPSGETDTVLIVRP